MGVEGTRRLQKKARLAEDKVVTLWVLPIPLNVEEQHLLCEVSYDDRSKLVSAGCRLICERESVIGLHPGVPRHLPSSTPRW